MHVPNTYTENALEISLRSQTMTAYTGAATGRTIRTDGAERAADRAERVSDAHRAAWEGLRG